MPSPALRELFQAVAAGTLSVDQAAHQADSQEAAMRTHAVANVAGATVDVGRAIRCRFGEVIYGEGKSAELIQAIAAELIAAGQSVLVTRVAPAAALHLCSVFPCHRYDAQARTVRLSEQPVAGVTMIDPSPALPRLHDFHVAVVTAGSTDRAVAVEAIETLAWMGVAVDFIEDVGVAGPQRLLAVVPRLRAAAVVVVVAGMEGALPSVVGGHVACPVIAVPTSVGYGAALGGLTPMLGMLTSCASNVTVVGIDAGFKGGYVSGLIATQLRDLAQSFASQNLGANAIQRATETMS